MRTWSLGFSPARAAVLWGFCLIAPACGDQSESGEPAPDSGGLDAQPAADSVGDFDAVNEETADLHSDDAIEDTDPLLDGEDVLEDSLIQGPTIVFEEPAAGAYVQGIVPVRVTLAGVETAWVAGVEFTVDGEVLRLDEVAPFTTGWPVAPSIEGDVELTASVVWGPQAPSPAPLSGTVHVVVDRTPPVLSVISPLPGTSVERFLQFRAEAVDIAALEFLVRLDGTDAAAGASNPFVGELDLADLAFGQHQLTVRVTDGAGNDDEEILDVYRCADDQLGCDGECQSSDYFRSVEDCGACDATCEIGPGVCVESECACRPPAQFCDGACVSLTGNPLHCGACGVACDPGDECVDGECAQAVVSMSRIPAGTFLVGSPTSEAGRVTGLEDQVEITLTVPFLMDRFEVTQGAFLSAHGTNPSAFDACGSDCPVDSVTWWDAVAHANARSEAEGLAPCYQLNDCNGSHVGEGLACSGIEVLTESGSPLDCVGYRLPTEAEFEYAYRAGTVTAFYSGDGNGEFCGDNPVLNAIAWYCGTTDRTSHPVGQLSPNAYGLYDMAGNLFEWTWSFYARYPVTPMTDYLGPDTGGDRVIRGGSFNENASRQRAATRLSNNPSGTRDFIGFRLVRSVGTE